MPASGTGPKTNGAKVTITPTLENCDETITPDCLRALYAVNYTPVATDKNSYGIGVFYVALVTLKTAHPVPACLIVEFTPQAFLADDLDLFFR